jgi:hypothetical protein
MAVEVRRKGKREVMTGAGKETKEVERSATSGHLGGAYKSSVFHRLIFLVIGFEHTSPLIPVLSIPVRIQLCSEGLSKRLERAQSFTERCSAVFL